MVMFAGFVFLYEMNLYMLQVLHQDFV